MRRARWTRTLTLLDEPRRDVMASATESTTGIHYTFSQMYLCFDFTAAPEAKEDPEKLRFQTELEFVQCLSNPHYLNCI